MTEKALFAMGLADVLILCVEREEDLWSPTFRIGSDTIRDVVTMAHRVGIKGVVVWCRDAVSDAAIEMLKQIPKGNGNVIAAKVSIPTIKEELLDSVFKLSSDFHRHGSQLRAQSMNGARAMTMTPAKPTEMECKISSLEGETIAVGDRYFTHCLGSRFQATVASIDVVFEGGQISNVTRRDAQRANGNDGVAVTLILEAGISNAPTSAIGLPSVVLIKKDAISDAVLSVLHAVLLAVSADDEDASSDEDLMF
jgi:hypothetical protein